jgi:hypothetical protein
VHGEWLTRDELLLSQGWTHDNRETDIGPLIEVVAGAQAELK